MKLYHVQRATPDGDLLEEREVMASSAEDAATLLVPEKLSRGGKAGHAVLRAKVYWLGHAGAKNLVRLYERPGDQAAPSG